MSRPETTEELKAHLYDLRMGAFSLFRQITNADKALLHAFGYPNCSNADALLLAFKSKDREITKVIEDFERRHPR